MIKKIFIMISFLTLSNCIGFNSATGLKFKTGDERIIKLKNDTFVFFEMPIGNCGVRMTFFGIVLPIIPIQFYSNSCENSFDINLNYSTNIQKLKDDLSIKLRYNGVIYNSVSTEKLIAYYGINGEKKSEYGKKFKFKIDNFEKFKKSNDKTIIISGKINEKEFIEELPVKWSIVFYKNSSIPW